MLVLYIHWYSISEHPSKTFCHHTKGCLLSSSVTIYKVAIVVSWMQITDQQPGPHLLTNRIISPVSHIALYHFGRVSLTKVLYDHERDHFIFIYWHYSGETGH